MKNLSIRECNKVTGAACTKGVHIGMGACVSDNGVSSNCKAILEDTFQIIFANNLQGLPVDHVLAVAQVKGCGENEIQAFANSICKSVGGCDPKK